MVESQHIIELNIASSQWIDYYLNVIFPRKKIFICLNKTASNIFGKERGPYELSVHKTVFV